MIQVLKTSKDGLSVIIANDSFNTIITTVKEGRKIFDNIRKVLIYLLTGNITEILVVFSASILKAIVVGLIYFVNLRLYNVEVAKTVAF